MWPPAHVPQALRKEVFPLARYSYQYIDTDHGRRLVRQEAEPAATAAADTAGDVNYRDLQAQAKELGIPANQSREDLTAAIAEAGA
jgi:hypothetical protein